MKTKKIMLVLNIIFLLCLIMLFAKSNPDFDPNNVQDSTLVPSDYSGNLNVAEGSTVTIGGTQYTFGRVAKLTVDKGTITQFDGIIAKPANLGGSIVSGTLSYEYKKYTFTDGVINNINVKNAYDISASGSAISGIANKECSIDGNEIGKNSKFTYDKEKNLLKGEIYSSFISTYIPTVTKANPDTNFAGTVKFASGDKELFTLASEKPTSVIFGNSVPAGNGNFVLVNDMDRTMMVGGEDMVLTLHKEIQSDRMTVKGQNIQIVNGGVKLIFNKEGVLANNPSYSALVPIEIVNDFDRSKVYKVLQNGAFVGSIETANDKKFILGGTHSRAASGVGEVYFAQFEVADGDVKSAIEEFGKRYGYGPLPENFAEYPEFQEILASNANNMMLITQKTTSFSAGEDILKTYIVTGNKDVKSDYELAGFYKDPDYRNTDSQLRKDMDEYFEFSKKMDKISQKGSKVIMEIRDGKGVITSYPYVNEPGRTESKEFGVKFVRGMLSTFLEQSKNRVPGQTKALLGNLQK